MILKILKRLWPEKLQSQVILLALGLIFCSTISIAYLIEMEARSLLLKEKENKLFVLTQTLDFELGDLYNQISPTLPKAEQIRILNEQLSPRIEKIIQNTNKIGVGYYHKALDAIILYAPNKMHADKIGLAIDPDHPGREVMATRHSLIRTGIQVRGNIMNAMQPIIRDNTVIGYIWANELIDDINKQFKSLDQSILLVCLFGFMVSILVTMLFSRKISSDINTIIKRLNTLPYDLHNKIPALTGEMNEIVTGVNRLSFSLNEVKTINELILESTIDSVITIDNEGLITMLNPAAQKITGMLASDVIGKPYQTILDDDRFQSPLLDTLKNGINHVGVEVDFPVSGKVIQISSSTSHLRNHNGDIIGAVVIFKDLTEQNQLKRITEQTERLAAIGELMAGVAHEIRNPLTAIRGFVQYLKEGTSKKETDEYIAIILKEVDSINNVVRQLLDFARPPKNFYAPTSLNELINETLVLVNTPNTAQAIDFILHLDLPLPPLLIDREMIKQVLLNVFINAVQAIDKKGSIIITSTLSENGAYQIIEIHDSGKGISQDILARTTEPFFTTKPSGTGLGLAITQRIISSHKGILLIENHKAYGTIVTIKLPTY